MAKGRSDNAQANGLSNASGNFANGFTENGPPNENATDGLTNAAANNAVITSTTIDFESGVTEITEEYASGTSYLEFWGTYSEDGFTFDFDTYEYNSNGPAGIGAPVYDEDGDGDLEFGANDVDSSRENDNEYLETIVDVTQDNGEAFSLEGFDVQRGSDDDNFNYDYFEFSADVVNAEDGTSQYTSAFTEDGVFWDASWSSDPVTSEEVVEMFTNVDTLTIWLGGEFTVDDLVFV